MQICIHILYQNLKNNVFELKNPNHIIDSNKDFLRNQENIICLLKQHDHYDALIPIGRKSGRFIKRKTSKEKNEKCVMIVLQSST